MDLDRRASKLFMELCDLDADERAARLDEACTGDPELRAAVESLLEHDIEDFLEGGLQAPVETIGPYRIVDVVGEGGMGVVYRAVQEAPIHREVAVKLIKAGMDTDEVVARFERERQVLAMMQHPGIANVFEAGSTEGGRPYFVMEYIGGVSIVDYCDRERLGLRERLELFAQVCSAVQHAHQRGVIHRDIKPSNVLVVDRDGERMPKVIDFGIAKAIDQREAERTLLTESGRIAGTPEYMSPEQASMSTLIDTRTDVYALGVLLYELLVGVRPFSPERMRQVPFDELLRIIREEEPPRPSTRIAPGEDGAAEAARRRRSDPKSMVRLLRRDLDWIVMRSLEKDPARRYATVSDLAADVGRYLCDRPVEAGPPSVTYRAKKFMRRHRVGVLAAGVVTLGLVIGIAGTLVGLVRARTSEAEAKKEAATTRRAAVFLADMLGSVDPHALGRSLSEDLRARIERGYRERGASQAEIDVALASFAELFEEVNATDAALRLLDEEILARAATTIEKQLANEPELGAWLHDEIGTTYRDLGLYEQAERFTRKAVETRMRVLGEDDLLTQDSRNNLAVALKSQGKYGEAETVYRQALDGYRRIGQEDHPNALNAMGNLGNLLAQDGRYEEAERWLRESVERHRRIRGPAHRKTLTALNNLALLLRNQERFEEAEPFFLELMEQVPIAFGPDHPNSLTTINNVGFFYAGQARYEEAERYFRKALERRLEVIGEDHPDVAVSLHNVAFALRGQERFEEAQSYAREALEKRHRILGATHPVTLQSQVLLGRVLHDCGRDADAERYLREAAELSRGERGDDHLETAQALGALGAFLAETGRPGEGESLLRKAYRVQRTKLGEKHKNTHEMRFALASALAQLGERKETLEHLRALVAHGLEPAELENEQLDSLRGDPEFESLRRPPRARN